jgi:ribose 5-phosphate isomerase B
MIAIGCDHGGYGLKLEIIKYLEKQGFEYKDFGCHGESVDYPIYAKKVGQAILDGECEKGILICGTGIGISIAANKMKGIRCALCSDCFSAEATRLHNDTNIVALGGKNFEGKQILCIYFKNETYFPLVSYEKQPAGIPFGPYA